MESLIASYTSTPVEEEATKKNLFKQAMLGDWDSVREIFTDHSFARDAKITRTKDTVLHLAAMEGDEGIVGSLLKAIPEPDEASKILWMRNEEGNTPLHLAASLGLVGACLLMAFMCPELVIKSRNENGETPLFVAVKYGKKKAFFALQDAIDRNPDLSTGEAAAIDDHRKGDAITYCRRWDGYTILHAAVHGEYFASCVKDRSPKNCYVAPEEEQNHIEEQSHIEEQRHIEERSHSVQVSTIEDVEKGERSQSRLHGVPSMKSPGELHRHPSTRSWLPNNYITLFDFVQLVMKILLIILGIGFRRIEKIKRKKLNSTHAGQVMDELVDRASDWAYEQDGKKPVGTHQGAESRKEFIEPPTIEEDPKRESSSEQQESNLEMNETKQKDEKVRMEPVKVTPILVAAKRGVTEMVEKILNSFPVAVQDMDMLGKNIVLLAVEYRQPQVYRLMLKRKKMMESIFGKVDKEGNSALHLAAKLGENRPWIIPGAALQMQWEIKWYKFVKRSMDTIVFAHYNNDARQIFTEKHKSLVKDGGKWLTNTSQSCSLIAALIATVAFASATTVPGGANQSSGFPIFEGQLAFQVFAISALIALCFSVTALIMFLSILTSRYQEMDFKIDLPVKLILGLTSLFMSIAAMLVAFCVGHFFVIEEKLKYAAFPIYAITCLPVTFFAVAQFPLYIDLIKATVADVPERTYKLHTEAKSK